MTQEYIKLINKRMDSWADDGFTFEHLYNGFVFMRCFSSKKYSRMLHIYDPAIIPNDEVWYTALFEQEDEYDKCLTCKITIPNQIKALYRLHMLDI